MTYFYSKSSGGFYTKEVHGDKIPPDSVNLTEEDRANLLAGQSLGRLIQADASGFPVLIDYTAPAIEQLALNARKKRNELISATDYMVMPDYPLSASELLAVNGYRQALRDIPDQPGFPRAINWPPVLQLPLADQS